MDRGLYIAAARVLAENPRKEDDTLVTGTPAGDAGAVQVRASALEASGAGASRSMVDMVASLRAFEAGRRVIHMIDETRPPADNESPEAPVRARLFPGVGAVQAA